MRRPTPQQILFALSCLTQTFAAAQKPCVDAQRAFHNPEYDTDLTDRSVSRLCMADPALVINLDCQAISLETQIDHPYNIQSILLNIRDSVWKHIKWSRTGYNQLYKYRRGSVG